DHVLIAGGFLPPSRILLTAFCTLKSMNGPFFNERGISLYFGMRNAKFSFSRPSAFLFINSRNRCREFASSIPNSAFRIPQSLLSPAILHDHIVRAFVSARFITACRLSPGRHRMASAGGFALAAAVREIGRAHV